MVGARGNLQTIYLNMRIRPYRNVSVTFRSCWCAPCVGRGDDLQDVVHVGRQRIVTTAPKKNGLRLRRGCAQTRHRVPCGVRRRARVKVQLATELMQLRQVRLRGTDLQVRPAAGHYVGTPAACGARATGRYVISSPIRRRPAFL